ncbi:uncharacterized protein LOC113363962 isoform X1 [Ctenocephalides felis]|uniref:uncharacterized protein LOC113363961 n=1 Tax=Ctenocephalides felis TaxID=7515 RepID=UPI000E6E1CD3|nr:uncharacterized protein LOC113363961 [Ctenocephalides felis]XP_026462221.1 uncharacterized protein LOC113363962 isoform X1 [Ctenocephalides felis]
MSRRLPRRTRVYDCNYDKGESYYRPALDRLDKKFTGRLDKPFEERASSLTNAADDVFKRRPAAFDDMDFPSRRSGNTAREAFDEAVDKAFDYKGGLVSRGLRRPLSVSFDTDPDFADEVNSSLSKMRLAKKKIGFEDDEPVLRPRTRFTDLEDGVDSSATSSSMVARKRVLKISSSVENSSDVATSAGELRSGAKWTALRASDDEGGAAALRAKQSRALLADIESDLAQAAERQVHREKRLAGLRKMMAENREEDAEYERLMQRGEKVRSEMVTEDRKMLAF